MGVSHQLTRHLAACLNAIENTLGDHEAWLHHFSWQGEMKGGSSSIISSGPQLATVRLHNRATDGQPHTAAMRLGGKERRKDLIHLLGWQTHARVADRELELTVLPLRLHR